MRLLHVRAMTMGLLTMTACGRVPAWGMCTPVAEIPSAASASLMALPWVTAAPSDVQATELFLDPGAQYALDDGATPVENPNHQACEAAFTQLADDQQALRHTSQWEALLSGSAYTAVANDIKAVRREACNSVFTVTGHCKIITDQLNTAVASLWKTSEYLALQTTAEYAMLENDANAIAGIGLLWRRCVEWNHHVAAEKVRTMVPTPEFGRFVLSPMDGAHFDYAHVGLSRPILNAHEATYQRGMRRHRHLRTRVGINGI